MKHQTINLVKFKALSARLNLPLWQAVGLLESLWLFCQHNARDGIVNKFSALEIASWMGFTGDANEMIEALIETRWLDRDGDTIRVHDWEEHKPNWLKGIESPFHPRRTKPGTKPSTVLGTEPSTVPPSLTLPSPPLPNQTQPSPSKPAKGVAGEWGRVESEVLSEGVRAATTAVGTARERGATPADVRAIVAHFRTIKGQIDQPERTLYERIRTWYPGQPPNDGWPHVRRSSARYHEASPPTAPEDKAAVSQIISGYLGGNGAT